MARVISIRLPEHWQREIDDLRITIDDPVSMANSCRFVYLMKGMKSDPIVNPKSEIVNQNRGMNE